jgi:hypothetical protein
MSHSDARYLAERHQPADEDSKSDKRAFLQLLEQRVTNTAISNPYLATGASWNKKMSDTSDSEGNLAGKSYLSRYRKGY